MGFFGRLAEGLKKTRESMARAVDELVNSFTRIDEELFEELEETLIMSDVGAVTAAAICDELRAEVKRRGVTDASEVKGLLKEIIAGMLAGGEELNLSTRPSVILVIGVNGVGKTTTIGKLAANLKADGKKVLLGAADTFRAAAIEQLGVWAERSGVDMIRQSEGSDPAAVVFDAVTAGRARGVDVVICDTAGRLHNKKNLMDELGKISRVIQREAPGCDTEVLLVLDATTGQNALNRRASSRRPRASPASSSPSSTARRAAAWSSASSRNYRSRSNISAWASRSTICGPLTRRTLSTPSSAGGRKRRRTRDEGDRRDGEHGQAPGICPHLRTAGHRAAAQSEVSPGLSVEETGTTFAENAFLKADAVHERTGLAAVADDSGLCVDALDGAPGVYSARYAGEETPYPEKISRLLGELEGVPEERRTARFVAHICYIGADGARIDAEGTCEGKIGWEPRGDGGFGYDPIFYVGDRSFAELSAEEKDAVSHRGKALRELARKLNEHQNG